MSRATKQVIGLCLLVFTAQLVVGVVASWRVMGALFALALPIELRPWTLATSVYAHAGPIHLLSNLALFALLGVLLERDSSAPRFHGFVLVTGALAGLAQVYATALLGDPRPVWGLSGAVFACMGYLVTGNRLTSGLLDRVGLPTWAQLLVFVGLAGIVTWYTASPGAALVGHFAGFLIGLLAGQRRLLRVRASDEPAAA